ncbi:hypothetical protein A3D14_01880 [Candidatus Saccharibacteria bacterium RIFCSPHIGHO2_02_FULL_47_12]|nr:MAG: hypothetical protein A3D14_01880 [Candidatus Saccharibacteria bacterium RIFCSPHIGHO2_02_FULL_47_12]
MDEDTIADLKQFITATISQQMANVAAKEDLEHLAKKKDLERVEKKIDDIQTAVQHSAINYTSAVDEQVQDHEKRLTKLEQKTA